VRPAPPHLSTFVQLACLPEARLRSAQPPVIARIEHDRLLVDLRTVFPEEEAELARALQALSW